MNRIMVHIERVVVEGRDAGEYDAAALRAAMSAAVARGLVSSLGGSRPGRVPGGAFERLRAPDVALARAGGLGASAGESLVATLRPLCGAGSGPMGGRRG
jgi:hypothetical protein